MSNSLNVPRVVFARHEDTRAAAIFFALEDGRTLLVPHDPVYYTSDGLEFGYLGDGPTETVLSIINVLIPPGTDGEEPGTSRGGKASETAWRLHQDLSSEFIARVDKDRGGRIYMHDLYLWIAYKEWEHGRSEEYLEMLADDMRDRLHDTFI